MKGRSTEVEMNRYRITLGDEPEDETVYADLTTGQKALVSHLLKRVNESDSPECREFRKVHRPMSIVYFPAYVDDALKALGLSEDCFAEHEDVIKEGDILGLQWDDVKTETMGFLVVRLAVHLTILCDTCPLRGAGPFRDVFAHSSEPTVA